MALIECEFCGEPMSEDATKCPHCGCYTKTMPQSQTTSMPAGQTAFGVPTMQNGTINTAQPKKHYNELSDAEQSGLAEEFLFAYPQYREFFGKLKNIIVGATVTAILPWVWGILSVGLVFLALNISAVKDKLTVKSIIIGISILGGILIILIILKLVFSSKGKNATHKQMVMHKRMQAWLEKERGIEYSPDYETDEEKRQFALIKVDEEERILFGGR